MPDREQAVDLAMLTQWMDERGLGQGPIEDVRALGGGTQNIVLWFRRATDSYVLRRPPLHPRPESNETMRREMRVLSALRAQVPHPALIATCPDENPLGTAFYLMAPVNGVNVTEGPTQAHCDPAVQYRMGIALAEAAAALGEIEPLENGLDGFGKTENFLQRQPGRWRKQLDGYSALEGWPGPHRLPGADEICIWLERNCPSRFRPGIIHGDYHIGNILFEPNNGEIAAIVDWELSTVGDPLIDLGWLIATWAGDDGSPPIVPVDPWVGFPTSSELIGAYAQRSSRDLSFIDWYAVLACFKMGVLLEGTHARACAGMADKTTGQSLHDAAVRLFERGLVRIR